MNVQERKRGSMTRDIFFRSLCEPRDIYALAGKHRAAGQPPQFSGERWSKG